MCARLVKSLLTLVPATADYTVTSIDCFLSSGKWFPAPHTFLFNLLFWRNCTLNTRTPKPAVTLKVVLASSTSLPPPPSPSLLHTHPTPPIPAPRGHCAGNCFAWCPQKRACLLGTGTRAVGAGGGGGVRGDERVKGQSQAPTWKTEMPRNDAGTTKCYGSVRFAIAQQLAYHAVTVPTAVQSQRQCP